MAIACFRFFTFFLPPDFNSPCLYSCITFPILLRTFRLDLGSEPEDDCFFELAFLDPLFFLAGTTQHLLSLETSSTVFVSVKRMLPRGADLVAVDILTT